MDSWLYDEDEPFIHVEALETFEFLKKQVGTGYYEALIRKYLPLLCQIRKYTLNQVYKFLLLVFVGILGDY